MKNFRNILEEIKINENHAKELDAQGDALWKKAEISAAESIREKVEIRKSIIEEDENRAGELYKEAERIRGINRILEESAKASFAEYAAEIIREIMQKYAGKQRGEKTREKIREEAKKAGISFYFDGYHGDYYAHAQALTPEGFTDYNAPKVELFATDAEGKTAYFIDENNKISDFQAINITHHYKYTENPDEKRADIEAAYSKYLELYEAAKAAQDALNAIIPDTAKRFDAIGHLSPHHKF
jgi:hypothetical protein